MIDVREIRENARTQGVPESTIERDYVQNWFLKVLYSKDRGMVFKGGTAIRKAHIKHYRFSDDLDFTMVRKVDKSYLETAIRETVDATRKEVGINFDNNIRLEPNDNGWEGRVFFRLVRQVGSPVRIKLDISKEESEKVMLPAENIEIFHDYSDECRINVNVYSLQEIVAEKVRSLFQRVRPRDLYDVCTLWDKIERNHFKELFHKKCEFKVVIPKKSLFSDKEDLFRYDWERTIQHQIKDLQPFDEYFKTAQNIMDELEIT